ALPWMSLATVSLCGLGLTLRFLPKTAKKPRTSTSIAATALIWVVVGLCGALPFLYTGLSFIDAAFESMSAWTGTGFTIAPDIESWPKTMQFWRSFMQWIGGLGIIAFTLTVATRGGLISRGLYRSEGRSEAFMPSVIATAFQMWKIYVVLTVIAVLAIMLTGIGLWDAVNLALCGIATGGMTLYAAGISHFNNLALEMVMIPIMLAGAIPFRLYYLAYSNRSLREVFHDRVLRTIAGIFLFVSAVLILDLTFFGGQSVPEAVRQSLFMAGTAISSTGFQNTTFAGWGAAPILFLAVFMLMGGAQGSTAGGVKIDRMRVLFDAVKWWFRKTASGPRAVVPMRHNGAVIEKTKADIMVAKSLLLVISYILLVILTLAILLHDPYFAANPMATIFDVFSCVGNNGTSLGLIGPLMPDYAKALLFVVMWIARLEIIPALILIWGTFRGFGWEPVIKRRKNIRESKEEEKIR
ncbi:MAG: TrkH family potassium uptake protein, partial [Methanocorpusculum sp.]|nr:TrkH family potassium uptake protein [Methanocorpusculum sp.]